MDIIEKLKEAIKLENEDRGFMSVEDHRFCDEKNEIVGLSVNECLSIIKALESKEPASSDSAQLIKEIVEEFESIKKTKCSTMQEVMFFDGVLSILELKYLPKANKIKCNEKNQ